MRQEMRRNLADYVSIVEANPDAECGKLCNALNLLKKRWLFEA
jgi:hypothetical protein